MNKIWRLEITEATNGYSVAHGDTPREYGTPTGGVVQTTVAKTDNELAEVVKAIVSGSTNKAKE